MGYNSESEMQQKASLVVFIFTIILTLIFAAAKVFGFIIWGWVWIFCPIWGPMALGLILLMLGAKPPGQ